MRWTVVLLLVAGCSTSVPDVEPGAFACVGDELADDGKLQCAASDWCDSGQCRPRLRCSAGDAVASACEENVTRCELTANGETAAVSCESGLHVIMTSTTPPDPPRCDCPDGTYCVALGEGTNAALPLYILPPDEAGASVSLPSAALSAPTERPDTRICARSCSGELDCPAGHVCRPAPVVQAGLLRDPTSSRHTVGVCYPERIFAGTSTTPEQPVLAAEPDPDACANESQCSFGDGESRFCQIQVVVIPDHPTVPAGAPWGTRRALIPRCVLEGGVSVVPDGRGCNPTDRCASGACVDMRCARLCDPLAPSTCFGGEKCIPQAVTLPLPGTSETIRDLVWMCTQ